MRFGHLPADVPIVLDNNTCPYCGRPLNEVGATKEHVIGRRFVPLGTLDRRWNLILQACPDCNSRKADLEDDVSAISMQPSVVGGFARADVVLRGEANRKGAGSRSRITGKAVRDSSERIELRAALAPGASVTFGLIAPPQQVPERVFELARMQLSGFFYWITFDQVRRTGGFWLGGFCPIGFSLRGDWGNPVQKAFMSSVLEWEPRIMAGTADGFFKIALRRHPNAVCWSWALEWNENVRIIGFCGEEEPIEATIRALPTPEVSAIPVSDGHLEVRVEAELSADEDSLFRWEAPV